MQYFLIFIFTFINITVYSQDNNSIEKCCEVDEYGVKQGYWKLPDAFNLVIDDKIVKGFEVLSSGDFKNGKRIGTWKITSQNESVSGYRIFSDDGSFIEVQLKNKRPISIITFKKVSEDSIKQKEKFQITEILSFNKCGKFKRRYTYQ